MASTRRPIAPHATARFAAVVVLPIPPFCELIAITLVNVDLPTRQRT